MSDILALSIPPLELPTTIGLPKTPTGASPGSLILTVFAAGLDTLAQYAAQKIIPKLKTDREIQDDYRSDNKHVVKMRAVSEEIDKYLNVSLNAGLIGRTAAQMFTGKTPKAWNTFGGDPGTTVSAAMKAQSDAEWQSIREGLKAKIRERLLQQHNKRVRVVDFGHFRIGKMHSR
jgi:hypothetical protein